MTLVLHRSYTALLPPVNGAWNICIQISSEVILDTGSARGCQKALPGSAIEPIHDVNKLMVHLKPEAQL